MLRPVLLALVAAWIASVVRMARAWRGPAAAVPGRYDRGFAV